MTQKNVVDMSKNCGSVGTKDVSKFKTSNVIYISSLFEGFSVVIKLDVSSFDTSKVTRFTNMFSGIAKITFLDLTKFKTSNVNDMPFLLDKCISLYSADIQDSIQVKSQI